MVVYIQQEKTENYVWRRLRVSQEQAERQKKSVCQLILAFDHRATRILQDPDAQEA